MNLSPRDLLQFNEDGTLKNERWETFANAYVRTLSFRKATIEAGFGGENANPAQNTIRRLSTHPLIKARIEAIQNDAAKRNEISIDSVLSDLKRLSARAEADGRWTAAIRATELLGRHVGMFEESGLGRGRPLPIKPADLMTEIARLTTTLKPALPLIAPAIEASFEEITTSRGEKLIGDTID